MSNSKLSSNSFIQSEQYWKKHIALKRSSGLTRAEYCRKNNLKIHQLEYWERKKIAVSNSTKLLPLKLVSNEALAKDVSQANNANKLLCKLKLKHGNSIKVYDTNILSIILNVLK